MPASSPTRGAVRNRIPSWALALLIGWCMGRLHAEPNPVILTNQHVDIHVRWTGDDPEPLAVAYWDADGGVILAATNAVLRVPEAARLELPDGFPELGPAGSFLWILPQSQDPGLVFLGFRSAVPAGVLSEAANLSLREVRGPGDVVLWQAGIGGLDIGWSTLDGLDGADRIPLSAGSHGHYNLGFSTNGIYELVLGAEGTAAGTGEPVRSADTVFRVEVLPLPEIPAGPARLTVVGPPVAGRLPLLLEGTPGAVYRIESGADLAFWEPVGEVTAGADPVEFDVPHDPEAAGLFVRATHP